MDTLKPGSVYARISHGVVVAVDKAAGHVTLRNESGVEWNVGLNVMKHEFHLAGGCTRSQKVNVFELKTIFQERVGANVFSLVYMCQGRRTCIDAIVNASNKHKRRKLAEQAICGAQAELVGRLLRIADDKAYVLNLNTLRPSRHCIDISDVVNLVLAGVKYFREL